MPTPKEAQKQRDQILKDLKDQLDRIETMMIRAGLGVEGKEE